jgi:hypothetical protein
VSADVGAVNLVVVVDRAEWAARIRARWQDSVAAIIDVGRLLGEAKASLPPSEWLELVTTDLKFTTRTVNMLISVSENKVISESRNHGSLPARWRTLYELSRLPAPVVMKAITDGTINRDMERRDVAKLRPIVEIKPVVEPAPVRDCFCGAKMLHGNQPKGCKSAELDRCLNSLETVSEIVDSIDVYALHRDGTAEWYTTISAVIRRLRHFQDRLEERGSVA